MVGWWCGGDVVTVNVPVAGGEVLVVLCSQFVWPEMVKVMVFVIVMSLVL
jgi:hypothetical protein